MKRHFDEKAVPRSLQTGDQVLVLLPIPGSSLSARFSGPYCVGRKLSDTDYVIQTPDRRRKSRVCHVNMLKLYHAKVTPHEDSVEGSTGPTVKSAVPAVLVPGSYQVTEGDEDGLELRSAPQQTPRLLNSQMLLSLDSHLAYLDEERRADMVALIRGFPCLFGDVPSLTTVLKHDIDVGGAAPIRQHPYRVNTTKRLIMSQEASYLVENNLASSSSSPWSSPCLLVPKPDGTFRFCTDYRKVNAVTIPDSYPLPRIDDCVDTIGSARYVTKLDLLKGYWQVPLTARASEISAFVTPDKFQQYSVMAFGMRNAPATSQRLVNITLADVPHCATYLDDVVVYSSHWATHVNTLTTVLKYD